MATTTHLLTVREFSQLPEDDGPTYHELQQGEIKAVTRPKWKHFLIQRNLREYLQADGELRVADVAWISAQRLRDVDPEGYFHGVPELVIKVLSPSNTATDLYHRENLCLSNGGLEFWVVDPARCQIQVSTPDRRTVTFTSGEQVPLPLFGASSLRASQIFGQVR